MINWSTPWNTLWLNDGAQPRTLVPHYEKAKIEDWTRMPMLEKELVEDSWKSVQAWGAKHGYRFKLRGLQSCGTLDTSGRCEGWHFEVDVLSHRAVGSVRLIHDVIELEIKPNPGPGCDVFEMVGRGFLPTRYLGFVWEAHLKQTIYAPTDEDFLLIDTKNLSTYHWDVVNSGCQIKLSYGENPKVQSAHDIEFHAESDLHWYWSLFCPRGKDVFASWRAKEPALKKPPVQPD